MIEFVVAKYTLVKHL